MYHHQPLNRLHFIILKKLTEKVINITNAKIKVGIGFFTGRKVFSSVIKTYMNSWRDSILINDPGYSLNLFVAYDLKYSNTKPSDYMSPNVLNSNLDSSLFIHEKTAENEINYLVRKGVLSQYESNLLLGTGYAKKRNTILYFAIKHGIDYIVFIDDDEYPIIPVQTDHGLLWKGQQIIKTHLEHIGDANITHGYHCGYVSPIPNIKYDNKMTEDIFRLFIETLSNDIISWDSIKEKMRNDGLTDVDTKVLKENMVTEVEETNGMKFISGSNLCINLKDPNKVFPFYNPPNARGEDTFLSTCLTRSRVLKVPCYAFHDGFGKYNNLLSGALPSALKPVNPNSAKIINRFFRACIGWIRYKPLIVYITNREHYKETIEKMKCNLKITLPIISEYFNSNKFNNIYDELIKYDSNVELHYEEFENTKKAWIKVIEHIK